VVEDKVIVKNTFGGTFRKVFWKCIKLVLVSPLLAIFLYVLIAHTNSVELVIGLAGTVIFGGYLLFYIIKMLNGKTIAIISNEGIAVESLDLTVIKWENIRSVKKGETLLGTLLAFTGNLLDMLDFFGIIIITYVNSETGEEATVSFNTPSGNFTHSQTIKIIKKFHDK